jgi:hypothetical protein
VTGICYPPGADWSCAYSTEELDEIWADPDSHRVADRANALAWSTLSALLGYRLSLCPVQVRPCSAGCAPGTWDEAQVQSGNFAGAPTGGVFAPYVSGGQWFNGCGCRSAESCSCVAIRQIVMPSPVGAITEVWLNGAILDPSAYRVDNGDKLVRQDGGAWPACQDMNLPSTHDEAFVISYYPNLAANDLLRYAAGVLAVEYFKACSGKSCRLPNGVTSITRNGISMEIPSGLYPNGATGLREVDPIIRIYNPSGLKSPPRVMSPDSGRARVQTWVGAPLVAGPH